MPSDSSQIVLLHAATGCEVRVMLPADGYMVGTTLMALGEIGYTIPAAEGKTKLIATFEVGE